MPRYHLALLATAFSLTGGAALALTTQQVIDTLSTQGFTRIEIKTGPTQIKVEAIRGTEKLEQVFDSASGTILKSETEAVRPGENTAPGVSIRDRNRDFLRDEGNDDAGDDDGDDDNGDDANDDDGDDDNGDDASDDNGDDDNGDDGNNDDDDDDDDGDDDHGGDSGHGGDGDDGDDD